LPGRGGDNAKKKGSVKNVIDARKKDFFFRTWGEGYPWRTAQREGSVRRRNWEGSRRFGGNGERAVLGEES